MNNGMKRNKKERLEKLRKLKKVTFIISLVLNGLFTLLVIIGLCLPKGSDADNKNQTTKALKHTNNAIDFGGSNSAIKSYDFLKFYVNGDIVQDYYETNLNYTFNQDVVLLNGETFVASANNLGVSAQLHSPISNGDYFEVRARTDNQGSLSGDILYIKYQWSYQYEWSASYSSQSGSYFDSQNGFSLVYNSVLTTTSDFNLDWLNFFEPLEFSDLDLSQSWSPYAFFNGVQDDFVPYTGANKQVLVSDVVFGIGGKLYTNLYVFWSAGDNVNGTKYWDGSEVKTMPSSTYRYIQYVGATNIITNEDTILMTRDYYNWEYDEVSVLIMSPLYKLHFTNSVYSHFRLFDLNLSSSAINGFTKGQIFTTAYLNNYSIFGAGEGKFGDVFGLISSTFTGISDILAINVLPGLTLGVFVMLPLVAIIVFAIIRVVKK